MGVVKRVCGGFPLGVLGWIGAAVMAAGAGLMPSAAGVKRIESLPVAVPGCACTEGDPSQCVHRWAL
ncbi:hypothetical protein M2432_004832 [Mycobacterium sp. OTB74]|jgi:hypothetical protein|nr:hypothetical protein [Mycobacterium sp. OTB74]